jgi:hypothetical protein
MKRVYLKPDIKAVEEDMDMLICNSVISEIGIGYGGVNEEGGLDPASRRHDVWEDE